MPHGRCIEQLVWDDGPNLLGRGGKVYLDHDTGIDGCSYGVHYQTGWFYPCQPQWRFFNLQGTGVDNEESRIYPIVEACRYLMNWQRPSEGSVKRPGWRHGSTKRPGWLGGNSFT